jgi:hypothetical protein
MLKAFLRYGWANTALILALGLLPVVNLAGTAIEPQGAERKPAGIQRAIDPKVIAPLAVAFDVAPKLYEPAARFWQSIWRADARLN